MPTPVTDPDLLAQLDAGDAAPAITGGKPVTDPNLLAQLEGGGQRGFFDKLGNFLSKVYNDPPPSIAAARDVIKGAPAAATELTWGADPQAAEQAAGTIAQGAGMGLGFRGLGGEGVAARPLPKAGAPMPTPTPAVGSASQQAVEAGARLPARNGRPAWRRKGPPSPQQPADQPSTSSG